MKKFQTIRGIVFSGLLILLIAALSFMLLPSLNTARTVASFAPTPATLRPASVPTATSNPAPTTTPAPAPTVTSRPTLTPAPTATLAPKSAETPTPSPSPSLIETTPAAIKDKAKTPLEAGLIVPPPDLGRSAGRWIDLNLSDGNTRLVDNNQVIKELPSAWGYGTPGSDTDYYSTPPNVYYIYEKRDYLQYDTLFGTGYFRGWVGFDALRLNGFHSFILDQSEKVIDGRLGPVSHGCVRVEDWRSVYDFAQIGMPVVVHGEYKANPSLNLSKFWGNS